MDPHAERIREMFSSIAGRYDRLNRVLSLTLDRGWRRGAVQALRLPPDGIILDVCAGTGDLAATFLAYYPHAEVVALDFAEPMLQLARRKRRLQPVLGDALRLPFPDERFDALGCAFGIRNLSDLDKGLQEFSRVLRPGGSLLILEFTSGDKKLLSRYVCWYIEHVVPLVGRFLSHRPGAYRYLSQSVAQFRSADELIQRLAKSGFQNVKARNMSWGACVALTALKSSR